MRSGNFGCVPVWGVVVFVFFLFMAGQAAALEWTSDLVLDAGFDGVSSSFMGPAGEFGYFVARTDPAKLAKVDLATSSVVDSITLQPGESDVKVALVDPSGQFAYLATYGSQSRIIRIDLENFVREDHLDFPSGYSYVRAGVISPSSDFAYFATDTSPGYLLRVDLIDFLYEDSIEFPDPEVDFRAAAMDPAGNYIYLVSGQDGVFGPPPRATVVKVDRTSFSRVDALRLGPGGYSVNFASVDSAGEKLWLATGTNPGRVLEVDLTSFGQAGSMELSSEDGRPFSGLLSPDDEYAFLGTQLKPGRVLKVDLERNVVVRSVETGNPFGRLMTALPRPVEGKVFFGADVDPARIAKFTTAAPELRFQAETLDLGEQLVGYFSPSMELSISNPGTEPASNLQFQVVGGQFRLVANDCAGDLLPGDSCQLEVVFAPQNGGMHDSNLVATADGETYTELSLTGRGVERPELSVSGRVTGSPTSFVNQAGVVVPGQNRAVYATQNFGDFQMHSIDLELLEFTDQLGSLGSEEAPRDAVIDSAGEFVYFGIESGRIIRIDVPAFEHAGQIDIPSSNALVWASAIDPGDEFGYFATAGDPARIVKVRLSTFQIEDEITFPQPTGDIMAGFIDSAGEFLYFTFWPGPGATPSLVRVDSQTFQIDGELELSNTEWAPLGAMIDADDQFAYIYDYLSFPPRLSRVDLTSFSLAGFIELDDSPGAFQAGAVDPSGQFLFMAVDGSPSRIYRIAQSEFSVVDDLALSDDEEWTLPSTVLASSDGGAVYVTHDDELVRIRSGAPELRFEPSLLAVDQQGVGAGAASSTVRLHNDGSRVATDLGFSSYDEGILGFNDACTSGIQPGGSCSIEVTYDPGLLGIEPLSLHANSSQNAAARLDIVDAGEIMIFSDDFSESVSVQ